MQELILIEPGSTAPKLGKTEWTREAEHAAIRSEFEERLADSSGLAFRVARGVLKNDADAEDVAQESLIRAFRKFARLRDRNRFRAWLVRISFRLALDRLRSSKCRELREAEWMREQERSRPANSQASREFQQHLERAMEELPEKLRLALLLSAMEGHSLEEIAVLLSVPVGTVKSRIFFARKQLAEKLRCFVTLTTNR
ncbi:MAG: sigma-70 family RNA polymerase sigma factor [Acidobacteria bacterium]|nr:sigma-70 family RNA polymerase sigma factor [Acidobacteriota bacterium]MBS1865347.1 sigma-70 family RNA polymerase sigma factor [Acidobacteriota bacterium]